MPHSSHIHKSMLLRGVKLPSRALDQSDIEGTRSRAARSGRSHGGVPLRGNGGSRGRDSFNYAGSNSFSRPQIQNQQSYRGYNDFNNNYAPPQYQAGSHLHPESQDSQKARLHLHQAHMVPTPTFSPIRRNLAPLLTAININLRCHNSDMVRPTITEIIAMDVLIMDLLVTVDIKELHEFKNLFARL